MKLVLGWGVVLILCTQDLSRMELILVIMLCIAITAIPERKRG